MAAIRLRGQWRYAGVVERGIRVLKHRLHRFSIAAHESAITWGKFFTEKSDGAGICPVKAKQQSQDCRFSRSGFTDQPDISSLLQRKRDVVQDGAGRVIAEIDLVELKQIHDRPANASSNVVAAATSAAV